MGYLKRLIVRGFRTYKDRTAVEFCNTTNAIVGYNGSGKSNMLGAISFVVCEVYNSKMKDKKSNLHEGARDAVSSALIELVIDNTDRRISHLDKDEVRLCREIGGRRDEYQIDGRKMSRNEFRNTLALAGFSKTNPFYLVQQGKVAEIATMSAESRLTMLKDFAGIGQYEEKRDEALKNLASSKRSVQDVDQILYTIESKLKSLVSERDELRKYYRQRHHCAYISSLLCDKELADLEQSLVVLRAQREKTVEKASTWEVESKTLSEYISKLKDDLAECETQLSQSNEEMLGYNKSIVELKGKIGRIKLEREGKTVLKDQRKRNRTIQEANLKSLKASIIEGEQRLASLQNEQKDLESSLASHDSKIEELTSEIETMRCKRGSDTQTVDISARIEALEEEIKTDTLSLGKVSKQIEALQNSESVSLTRDNLTSEIEKARQTCTESTEELQQKTDQLANFKMKKNELTAKFSASKADGSSMGLSPIIRNQLSEVRSLCKERQWLGSTAAFDWEWDRLQSLNLATNHKFFQFKQHILCTPDEVFESANAAKEYRDLKKMYGPVWALIRVDSEFKVAVESALGSAGLESVVVDTADTCEEIIKEVKRMKRGNIVLSPLDQISKRFSHKENYPPEVETHVKGQNFKCIPLSQVIEAPFFLAPLINQLAGKWIIVDEMTPDTISSLCHRGYDCVTMQGDKVTRKGIVSGGYRVKEESILTVAERFRHCVLETIKDHDAQERIQDDMKSLDVLIDSLNEEVKHCSSRVEDLRSQLSRLEAEHNMLRNDSELRDSKLCQLIMEKKILEARISKNKAMITSTRNSLLAAKSGLPSWTADAEEIYQEKTNLLSKTENERKDMATSLRIIERRLKGLKESVLSADSRKSLAAMEESLKADLMEAHVENDELDRIEGQLTQVKGKKSKLSEMMSTTKDRQQSLKRTLAEKTAELSEVDSKLESNSDHVDTLIWKEKNVLDRANEMRKGKEISSSSQLVYAVEEIPASLQEEWNRLGLKELQDLKRNLTDKLESATEINQKAADELATYEEEATRLKEKRAKLQADENAIHELIGVLDKDKDRNMKSKFIEVDAALRDVFSKLVPSGHAKLVLVRKSASDRILDSNNDDSESTASSPVGPTSLDFSTPESVPEWRLSTLHAKGGKVTWCDNLRGIEVRASFTAGTDGKQLTSFVPSSEDQGTVEDEGIPIEADDEEQLVRAIKRRRLAEMELKSRQINYFPISLLSGGQKTVLALAVIFALQRIDRAPFYLLDEVDAALDDQYRTAVALMIKELSRESQFIFTTFRPQLCRIASKHFLVTGVNRCSTVEESDKENSLSLILSERESNAEPE